MLKKYRLTFKLLIFSIFGTTFFINAIPADQPQDFSNYERLPVKIVLFPLKRAVISSNIDSTLKKYKFKEGECFAENALLITLDNNYYDQTFLKAKAAEIEAKAAAEFADKNFNSTSDIFKKGAIGHLELEKSRLEKEIAKSRLDFAEANLKLSESDLESCSIKAPFSGRLTKKLLNEHEFVKKGQPVLEIIDDNHLLAVMHIPSGERYSMKIGQTLRIKVDETGSMHTGTVYEIAGEVDPGSRTFQVKALIDNKKSNLSAGMSGVLIEKNNEK